LSAEWLGASELVQLPCPGVGLLWEHRTPRLRWDDLASSAVVTDRAHVAREKTVGAANPTPDAPAGPTIRDEQTASSRRASPI
jgi:hypothetical protein